MFKILFHSATPFMPCHHSPHSRAWSKRKTLLCLRLGITYTCSHQQALCLSSLPLQMPPAILPPPHRASVTSQHLHSTPLRQSVTRSDKMSSMFHDSLNKHIVSVSGCCYLRPCCLHIFTSKLMLYLLLHQRFCRLPSPSPSPALHMANNEYFGDSCNYNKSRQVTPATTTPGGWSSTSGATERGFTPELHLHLNNYKYVNTQHPLK